MILVLLGPFKAAQAGLCRQLTGTVVEANSESVTVKLFDGSKTQVHLEKLSAEQRQFIYKTWNSKKAPKKPEPFDLCLPLDSFSN